MAEQEAVNFKVVGSNPTGGARYNSAPCFAKDRCSIVSVRSNKYNTAARYRPVSVPK